MPTPSRECRDGGRWFGGYFWWLAVFVSLSWSRPTSKRSASPSSSCLRVFISLLWCSRTCMTCKSSCKLRGMGKMSWKGSKMLDIASLQESHWARVKGQGRGKGKMYTIVYNCTHNYKQQTSRQPRHQYRQAILWKNVVKRKQNTWHVLILFYILLCNCTIWSNSNALSGLPDTKASRPGSCSPRLTARRTPAAYEVGWVGTVWRCDPLVSTLFLNATEPIPTRAS